MTTIDGSGEQAAPQVVNMFWQGSLSAIEIACIKSFVTKRIDVNVFSYEGLELPTGATLVDASRVLPEQDFFLFEDSPSAFSNIFRYKLLHEFGGWWVDTDVVFLGDQLPESRYYWAWEDSTKINGAILKFPAHDPLCARLLQLSKQRALNLDKWGALGPDLLTMILAHTSVDNAGSTTLTYPIHWLETHYLWFPEFRNLVEDRLKNATFLHLWHSMFARMGIELEGPVPEGSYICWLLQLRRSHWGDSDNSRCLVCDYLDQEWVTQTEAAIGRTVNKPRLTLLPARN